MTSPTSIPVVEISQLIAACFSAPGAGSASFAKLRKNVLYRSRTLKKGEDFWGGGTNEPALMSRPSLLAAVKSARHDMSAEISFDITDALVAGTGLPPKFVASPLADVAAALAAFGRVDVSDLTGAVPEPQRQAPPLPP